MSGQGSSSLWLLAIGLIAVFMVATMVAPAMINQTKGGSSPGGDNGSGDAEKLTFNAPVIALGSTMMEQDERIDLSLHATPDTPTTGAGGSFAWIVSIEGANGQGGGFFIHYGDQLVQWFAGQNGALVGIGPRFTQGPGATSVEVSADLTIIANMAGSFAFKAWIVEAKNLISLDPTNLPARSPAQSQNFQAAERIATEATVTQSLSGPDNVREDSWVRYTLTSQGHATGEWSSPVIERIAITKSGIRTLDVQARLITDRGSRTISWSDTGDRLVGTVQTTSPFEGDEDSESAEWTTAFELRFNTPGSYMIECWTVESGTDEPLGATISRDVVASRSVTLPSAPPAAPEVSEPAPPAEEVTPTPAPVPEPTPAPVEPVVEEPAPGNETPAPSEPAPGNETPAPSESDDDDLEETEEGNET